MAAGAFIWLWLTSSEDVACSAKSLAKRGDQTVVDQSTQLEEGQSKVYFFDVLRQGRVRVTMKADPAPVDVMLMTKEEYARFQEVAGDLFGGRYTYRQALSSKRVRQMNSAAVLPVGRWAIVVMRPLESLFGGTSTTAKVLVRMD